MIKKLIPIICVCCISACTVDPPPPKETEGYVPVYAEKAKPSSVSFQQPQAIENAGKIYVKDKLLYQVENGKGIHVISIADPSKPVREGFIPIAGAQEISILNNSLYTNTYNDLLVLDISSPENITITKYIENAFTLVSTVTPPESGYFECVDPAKGMVIGWTKKKIYSPKCKY
ncbi:hypothetical protein DC498_15490 [Terrimonas sp.]|uniref:hypothetical protein n=1 Tax=Terrimonas sp. TaxID=1914338 RepID=UPI000D520B1B|nr:hypothetical protein [Terrimonas sp.]PVD51282.1 hypothetical protein DC498_15490 [Terrimonas sp.]